MIALIDQGIWQIVAHLSALCLFFMILSWIDYLIKHRKKRRVDVVDTSKKSNGLRDGVVIK